MDLGSWSDWCGVLGFILSLALAVFECIKQRTKLRIQTAEYYVIQDFQDRIVAFLRAFVENRSFAPISISSAALSVEGLRGEALLGEHVIAGSTLRSAVSSHREELLNTPLPVNLNPFEAAEMRLVFRLPVDETLSPSLPAWVRNRLEQGSDTVPPDLCPLKLDLATSRRPVSLRFSARVCAAGSLMRELQWKNEIRS